jgi:hypothetical protein
MPGLFSSVRYFLDGFCFLPGYPTALIVLHLLFIVSITAGTALK